MNNWTRAKDAWIARECEGWHQIVSGPQRGFWQRPDGVHEVDEPSYLTDPAAAIRAAEAWRKKRGGRCGWEMGHGDTPVANTFYWSTEKNRFCKEYPEHVSAETPAAALAQALYRATGGPA